MKRYENGLYKWLIIAIIVIGLVYVTWAFTTLRDIVGAIPFDHATCQYPERRSNPPDGCDNTDPARPECMKGGTENCTIPIEQPIEKPIENVVVKTCQ